VFTRHYWGTSKVSRVLLIGPVAAATIAAPVDSLKVASVAAAPLNDCVSSDNGDPTLVSFHRHPAAVDVTDHSRRVFFSVRVGDTGGPGPAAGVRIVWVAFRKDSLQDPGVRLRRLHLNDAGRGSDRCSYRVGADRGCG
jgi:hypothetical protein